jgi:hypothetical protein
LKRYKQLDDVIRFLRPTTIVEVGTNKGATAERMCREALKHRDKVHYIGYDLFDDATADSDRREGNGKSHGTEADVAKRLSAIKGLTFELVKGNTRTTLHGTDVVADLAFIDGGHSVETILGDYEAVKGSNIIVFDDYYAEGADTSKVGCNRIIDGKPFELLPAKDNYNGLVIQFAVIGYNSAWVPAFERIRKSDGFKSIALWRDGFERRTDLICAVNSLESLPDPTDALESIRLNCRRFFFVLKADFRGLDWWRAELEKRFEIREWFGQVGEFNGPTTEVVGTAVPLSIIGELKGKGAVAEDVRFEQVKANIAAVSKRLAPPSEEPHGGTAILVCYGPSLSETWSDLAGHAKFIGGDMFSVSGAHDFLMRRNIVPKYHVEIDPRAHKAANLNRPNTETEYLIASCCHPGLVSKLIDANCNITLFHSANGEESLRTIDELEQDQFMVHGGGNAGLRAISVAYIMGYRHFVIYGMDCSFVGTQQWAGPHAGKLKETIEVVCDGEKFVTSAIMVSYARQFLSAMEYAVGAQFTLVGNGLLPAMIKAHNKEFLKEQEKAA